MVQTRTGAQQSVFSFYLNINRHYRWLYNEWFWPKQSDWSIVHLECVQISMTLYSSLKILLCHFHGNVADRCLPPDMCVENQSHSCDSRENVLEGWTLTNIDWSWIFFPDKILLWHLLVTFGQRFSTVWSSGNVWLISSAVVDTEMLL